MSPGQPSCAAWFGAAPRRKGVARAVPSAGVLRGGGQGEALRAGGGSLLRVAARALGGDRQARAGAERHADQPWAQLRGPHPGGRTARRVGQADPRRAGRVQGRGGRRSVGHHRDAAAGGGAHGIDDPGAARGRVLRGAPAGQGAGPLPVVDDGTAPPAARVRAGRRDRPLRPRRPGELAGGAAVRGEVHGAGVRPTS